MAKRPREEAESAGDILSNDERKALKRAKKEQAKSATEKTSPGDPLKGTTIEDEVANAELKARKKAEKAARKEAKAQNKASIGGNEAQNDGIPDKVANKAEKEVKGKKKSNGTGVRPDGDEIVVKTADKASTKNFLEEKEISVEDPLKQEGGVILAFDSLPFDKDTRKAYFNGFSAPTPIQAASWPHLLKGRDLIGVAETGSGKTFAFGLPCVKRINKDKKRIQACIVSPTRELAQQIQEQMTKLAEPLGLKSTCVYGGVSKDDQRKLLKGTHILVATPGRLNDFVGDGAIDLSRVSYIVLDEADRMLDKGFEQEVRKIISASGSSQERQTLMFTATWPPSVRDLAAEFLRDPVKVTIGDNASGELRANARIVQEVEVIEEMEKQNRLFQLLKQYQSGKNKKDRILVFCLYKKEATRIEEFTRRKGFPVSGIHGDLSQVKRTESLEAFKRGDVPLLVATDVAARGLDIPAVKLVLNVTFPLTAEDYVHRIGRTGRAGQTGHAITFFTQNEKGLAGALINVLKSANQPVPEELMKFGTTVKKKAHESYGAFFRDTGDMKKATKITFD